MFNLSQAFAPVLAMHVIAQSSAITECPSHPYRYLAWVEDGLISKLESAYLTLSSGEKIQCGDIVMQSDLFTFHEIKCKNGSTIRWQEDIGDALTLLVTDKNKSQWLMNVEQSRNFTCTQSSIKISDTIRAYQAAFQFTLHFEATFQREPIPNPAGF